MKPTFVKCCRFPVLGFLILSILLTGCSDKLVTQYGSSRGYAGDRSINGFGALRRTFQLKDWSIKDVSRLNDRLVGLDAIVWMPAQRDTLYDDATQWFDNWLMQSPRTLVYIVPDGGCEIEYFEIARTLAPPPQQLEYRRRIARLRADDLIEKMNQPAIPDNGWFGLERMPQGMRVDGTAGEWNQKMAESLATNPRPNCPIDLSYKVVDRSVVSGTAPLTNASSAGTSTPPSNASPFGKSWGKSTVDVKQETLLSAEDGSTAIARLTADQWGDSKIIVIANGSLLSNFSLATPFGQALTTCLMEETSVSPGEVGFLATDFLGASVSDVDPEINAQSGMELLTVWPMSLILLSLAVIGFVACMVLLPIFGRPRETEQAASSDFADHLDAVAALMSRSGGEEYARRRVSDYMRRIRGETVGPWILHEPVSASASTFHHSPPSVLDTGAATGVAIDSDPGTRIVNVSPSPATLTKKEES